MEWISVKDSYPQNGQKILIKVFDRKTNEVICVDCIFHDQDLYRSWEFKKNEQYDIIAKPTHWMPLPKIPKE